MIWLPLLLLSLPQLSRCHQQRPNIIFVFADDLGWNDVSYHGSMDVPTPNIDSLAKDGVILDNYYGQPLCTPSRGALMTGKYPIHLGLQHFLILAEEPWGLPLHHKLMPQYFNELGYDCHGVGKWHLGFFKEEYVPTSRGFQSFFGYWNGNENYFTHFSDSEHYTGLDLHDNLDLAWGYDGVYGTDLYTQKAINIIENHDGRKPLFLYVAQQAVHGGNFDIDPLQAPEEYVNLFPHIKNGTRKIFAGMIHSLDKCLGEIFESLRRAGMLNNTIIVFASDNGGVGQVKHGTAGSNFPLKGSKMTLWEGGVKVPAFIWSSALRQRKRITLHLMHVSDWLPTLYAAAGANPEYLPPLDGFNLWPTIADGVFSPRNEILLNIDSTWNMAALRKRNFKFLQGTYENGTLDHWYDNQGIQMKDNEDETDVRNRDSPELRRQLVSEYHRRRRRCPVAQILNRDFGVPLKEHKKDRIWRKDLTVKCGRRPADAVPCHPTKAPCLFDLYRDPCEYNNIAKKYSQIVNDLGRRVEEYKKAQTPIANEVSDSNSDPKLHCNAWVPWQSPRYRRGC